MCSWRKSMFPYYGGQRWEAGLMDGRMLFAFWAAQNRKNPGSVSATYLLTGERRAVKTEDAEGDVAMEDASQPAESEAPVRSVVIVSQEKLEGNPSPPPSSLY